MFFFLCNIAQVHLDEKKRAFGVSYYRHGLMKFAKATKEIILSAGAVMTPKILMNSGIGPREHLEHVGVTKDFFFSFLLSPYKRFS